MASEKARGILIRAIGSCIPQIRPVEMGNEWLDNVISVILAAEGDAKDEAEANERAERRGGEQ